MKYDYLLVGAGLFSAVVAYEMTKKKKKCFVIDRRNHLAGNIYTEQRHGINVHVYGAHIFHTDNREVWNFVNRFAEFNRYTNSPIANHNGRAFNLPFNMNTFNRIWSDVITPEQAKKRIMEQADEIKGEPKNLEETAISLVGRDIYELLIKGYTEKQWGRKCGDLPASIIKRLPVRYIYDNNYFNDKYQGIPIGGYTQIAEKMFAGAEIKPNCDYFTNKNELDKISDKIIFTGMIDEYYEYCFGKLEYRTLRFEHETLDIPNYQGNAVINYTDEKTPFTRIIEHKHFELGMQDKTVITREYPGEWKEGDEPYYPVNDEKNNLIFQKYNELAKSQSKVIFGGRLGQYRYFDMDDTVEAALELVKIL
jgi:UDP-galactopyranose mutase